MARIAVIGAATEVDGFGLAGAVVLPASGVDAVRAALAALPGDVAVLVLSAAAARDLGDVQGDVPGAVLAAGIRPLTVVMPA